MTAAGFAAAGQALAATLMDCTVLVQRNGAPTTPDPTTGVVSNAKTTIYNGPGRVKPYSRVTNHGVQAGETTDFMSMYTVSLPMSAATVGPGDVVHITASADPHLLTTVLRVSSVERSTQITARRMTCELIEDRTP
jgi:hypothetical protein